MEYDCDLKKAWRKIEESSIERVGSLPMHVQSVNTDRENVNEGHFDYKAVKSKLDSLYHNVGEEAQSSEFGGNEAWLIPPTNRSENDPNNRYPVEDGTASVFLCADDDVHKGQDSFSLINRENINGEYHDTELARGTIKEVFPKVKEINAGFNLNNVWDQKPKLRKMLALDGEMSNLLINGSPSQDGPDNGKSLSDGYTEWTGSDQEGPWLPQKLENYILHQVGNDGSKPFKVKFLKMGIKSPNSLDGSTPVMVEYEEL